MSSSATLRCKARAGKRRSSASAEQGWPDRRRRSSSVHACSSCGTTAESISDWILQSTIMCIRNQGKAAVVGYPSLSRYRLALKQWAKPNQQVTTYECPQVHKALPIRIRHLLERVTSFLYSRIQRGCQVTLDWSCMSEDG